MVVNDARFAEPYEAWEKAEERLLQELSLGGRLATPVNVIVHTYQDVNNQLAQGRPFFVDIARDGIVLHEMAGFPFVVRSRSRRRSGVSRLLGTSSGGFRVPVTLSSSRATASPTKCRAMPRFSCIRPPNGSITASCWS